MGDGTARRSRVVGSTPLGSRDQGNDGVVSQLVRIVACTRRGGLAVIVVRVQSMYRPFNVSRSFARLRGWSIVHVR